MPNVLLVDSLASYRQQVSWHLEQLGHTVFESENSTQAIDTLENNTVDLIVVDNDLLAKSGLALVPNMRLINDRAKLILIVDPFFLEGEHRQFLKENNVSKTLRGPLSPAAVSEQIANVLAGKKRAASSIRPAKKTPDAPPSDHHLKELRRKYQQKLPDELSTLGEMLERVGENPAPENFEAAHRLAHTIHGTSGTLGFEEISDLTGRIDLQLKKWLAGTTPSKGEWEAVYQVFQRARTVPERLSLVISVEPHTNNIATILVADRNAEFVEHVAFTCHKRCIDVRGATNREELIEAAQGGSLDGAVIDLDFGKEKSIVEIIASLRALEGRQNLPVALMSDDSSAANRVAAAHAGATHFLVKPPGGEELSEAVQHFVTANAQLTYRVLVVDDDEPFREHIAAILKEEGFSVNTLDAPTEILDIAESVKPDIILLDVLLPDITGYDVARMLRSTTAWKEIPILFLTAEADPRARLECFRSGGDDYIKKPVLKEELLARIDVRLERRRLYQERADRDALTNLPTRRAFIDMFKVRLAEGVRFNRPASLCLIDIDNFKFVNDAYGHLTGDRVLASLGQLLGSRFRTVDIRARWGGEEFTIVFYGEEKATAQMIMSRVLDEFRSTAFEGEHGELFKCTFSCGIAQFPLDGQDTDALFRIADERLYKAKDRGRNRIIIE